MILDAPVDLEFLNDILELYDVILPYDDSIPCRASKRFVFFLRHVSPPLSNKRACFMFVVDMNWSERDCISFLRDLLPDNIYYCRQLQTSPKENILLTDDNFITWKQCSQDCRVCSYPGGILKEKLSKNWEKYEGKIVFSDDVGSETIWPIPAERAPSDLNNEFSMALGRMHYALQNDNSSMTLQDFNISWIDIKQCEESERNESDSGSASSHAQTLSATSDPPGIVRRRLNPTMSHSCTASLPTQAHFLRHAIRLPLLHHFHRSFSGDNGKVGTYVKSFTVSDSHDLHRHPFHAAKLSSFVARIIPYAPVELNRHSTELVYKHVPLQCYQALLLSQLGHGASTYLDVYEASFDIAPTPCDEVGSHSISIPFQVTRTYICEQSLSSQRESFFKQSTPLHLGPKISSRDKIDFRSLLDAHQIIIEKFHKSLTTAGQSTPLSTDSFIRLEAAMDEDRTMAREPMYWLEKARGREVPLVDVPFQRVPVKNRRVLFIEGAAGSGKTTLLRWLLRTEKGKREVRIFFRLSNFFELVRGGMLSARSFAIEAVKDMLNTQNCTFTCGNEERQIMETKLQELLESSDVSHCLLLDAMDEVPAQTRESVEFKAFMSEVLELESSWLREAFDLVIITSRYHVKASVHSSWFRVSIVNVSPALALSYLDHFLVEERENISAYKDALKLYREDIFSTPLLLFFLCDLVLTPPPQNELKKSPKDILLDKLNQDDRLDRYYLYEIIVKKIINRMYDDDDKRQLMPPKDEETLEWMHDMHALVGFLVHLLSADVGTSAVQKYDVAFLFEYCHRYTSVPTLLAKEKDMKAIVTKLEEDAKKKRNEEKSARFMPSSVNEVNLLTWLLRTIGLVSAGPSDGATSLHDTLMFSHLSIQEYFTARTLLKFVNQSSVDVIHKVCM